MTVRTQAHHPSAGAIIPSAGLEANFVELYDLQDGGIDGTNMNLAATFAWAGLHSFDGNLLYLDATNNRIYEGATATTTIDSVDYQHQITTLSAGTATLALISTAAGATGVREASWHNSASPAISDAIYQHKMYGNNDAAAIKEYVRVVAAIDDETAGTEDGLWYVAVMKAGTLTNSLLVYQDQVQIRPESLVVGTSTNVGPDGFPVGVYLVHSDSNRRLACFSSTDATASAAFFDIYKNSASPAASDVITQLRFMGNDSAGNYQNYADINTSIISATSGSENSALQFRVVSNGTATEFLNGTSTAGVVTVDLTGEIEIAGKLTVTGSGDVTNLITSANTTNNALTIYADSLTTGSALHIRSLSASTGSRQLVLIENGDSASTNCIAFQVSQAANDVVGLFLQSGNETCLSIQSSATSVGPVLDIGNNNYNSANDEIMMSITGANAGAGDVVGIDFTGLSGSADYMFAFDANAGAPGAATGKIRCLIGGVLRYIAYT